MSNEVVKALFPQGTVRVRSEHRVNTFQGRAEIAVKTRELNDSRFLNSKFFDTASEKVLTTLEAPRGLGLVSVVDPLDQYYPDSLMVIAATPSMMKGNVIDTHHVYDMPIEMQRLYWAVVRETLRFNPGARYVENAAVVYSNEEHRTPRTIGLPHGQIGQIRPELVLPPADNEDLNTPEFIKEIEILRKDPRAKQALIDIDKSLRKSLSTPYGKGFHIYPRNDVDALPIGYSLVVPGNTTDTMFAYIMQSNFNAYTTAVENLLEGALPDELEGVIPQPSFRLYVEELNPMTHDGVIITLSPMIFSHAGVNEAGGMFMDKAPHYDDFVTSQERTEFCMAHAKHMKEKFTPTTTTGLKSG